MGAHMFKRIVGRNIYIIDLTRVLGQSGGVDALVTRCVESKFSSIWVRLARGAVLDANFQRPDIKDIIAKLANAGVDTWGWHVPFCATGKKAQQEAANIVQWARDFSLSGVLLDAEWTPEYPRFQGGTAEAELYATHIEGEMSKDARGIGLSSHDQPDLHPDLPFATFLAHVADNCPQVYYRSEQVTPRLSKSIAAYLPLEAGRDFKDRYKPTGNITMGDDLPFPDVATCLQATRNFLGAVKAKGFKGYSFWCWDTAPAEIWPLLKAEPV